ncbi:hypothetical protein ACFY4B_41500 [Kitasatospora sp. NPDC001261]|uniref:hypothetical protein n=1 Tax=Kitasatospora sp. NPDC001261 TaxID=3364012 RepID=UPI00369832DE
MSAAATPSDNTPFRRTGPFSVLPHLPQEPDVVFAVHPKLGIVAALCDHLPDEPAEILIKAGWRHLADLDIYRAPSDGPDAVAEATIRLRQGRYTVAVEPALPDTVLTCATTCDRHR